MQTLYETNNQGVEHNTTKTLKKSFKDLQAYGD
jgi:hypothetical protein